MVGVVDDPLIFADPVTLTDSPGFNTCVELSGKSIVRLGLVAL